MLDDLEGHDGKHEITEVWVEASATPPVTHRLTLFDARDCPIAPGDDTIWHIFGGSETVCGIVVSEASSMGHHIQMLDEHPEIDCEGCLTIMGWGGDLSARKKLLAVVAKKLEPHALPV